ncbi:MAG: hypothetical protein PHN49_10840, partial [Candidatus Omnitrophica bacterium]|nr:hypothetical protein [Candidatus Omnitrophota bacterium]
IVIGGKVKPARAGQKVFLESLSHARTVSTVTDDWGGFYFSHCLPGAYKIWAAQSGQYSKEHFSFWENLRFKKGKIMIEADSNRFDIHLSSERE